MPLDPAIGGWRAEPSPPEELISVFYYFPKTISKPFVPVLVLQAKYSER